MLTVQSDSSAGDVVSAVHRYSAGDQVESWLHNLLCLDAAEHVPPAPAPLPHPSTCELYFVERDTLFSFHAASEELLQRVVALLAASHYRNTPDDLLLLADAPAHRLFLLFGPLDETKVCAGGVSGGPSCESRTHLCLLPRDLRNECGVLAMTSSLVYSCRSFGF